MKRITASIAGTAYNIDIEKKRIKRMYLRVKADGTLYVTCPYRTSISEIMRFLESRADWIRKASVTAGKHASVNNPALYGRVYWFGTEIPVQYVPAARNHAELKDGVLVMQLKTMDEETITKLFTSFAAKEIKQRIAVLRTVRDEQLCDPYRLPRPLIRVRSMTSKWGVCYPDKHTITMNTNLVHYPEQCLDYVLLHEYVHFHVHNHSAAFYSMVSRFMPDYRTWMGVLKGK